MYKSNHTYYKRTFLSSLLKSFLRILLGIWRGITRDPKYKAIPETYKYIQIHTDRQEIPVQRPQSKFDTRQVEVHTQPGISCTRRRLEKSVPVQRN